jgi:dihydrolipoamide dehydrogenase
VALEMGTVYAVLGSEVTMAVRSDRLLRGADQDLVEPLFKKLKQSFKNIHFNTNVGSIKEKDGGVDVKLEGEVDKAGRVLIGCWLPSEESPVPRE